MRGLLLYLTNNGSLFLFLLLEAVCFYTMVRFNDTQQRVWLTTSNAFAGYFNKKADDVYDYFGMGNQMAALQRENKMLRQQLQYMAYLQGDSLLRDTALNGNFSELQQATSGKDTLYHHFTYIPVEVIDNSIRSLDNTLTLNRGRRDGIEPDMGVVNGDGVVGIVRQVSEHYSTVMSLLHRQTRISASIKRTGAFGVLRWHGDEFDSERIRLEDIPQHEIVNVGDTVVTTGYPLSNIFPKGVFIGLVEKAQKDKVGNFYTIDVKLNIRMSRVQHAYVVSLNRRQELLQLESQPLK